MHRMQSQVEIRLIEEIVQVTEKLIDLAQKGNDLTTEEGSRLFFGEVLDDSFKVLKMAKLELGSHRSQKRRI